MPISAFSATAGPQRSPGRFPRRGGTIRAIHGPDNRKSTPLHRGTALGCGSWPASVERIIATTRAASDRRAPPRAWPGDHGGIGRDHGLWLAGANAPSWRCRAVDRLFGSTEITPRGRARPARPGHTCLAGSRWWPLAPPGGADGQAGRTGIILCHGSRLQEADKNARKTEPTLSVKANIA